jgi:hypothetical protein
MASQVKFSGISDDSNKNIFKMNGMKTNGARTNGSHANGTKSNGSNNGTHTNGSHTNGTHTNGTHSNGTQASNRNDSCSDDYEPINVIIPIGGIGSRFAKQGYRYPKPLINIVGRPMLLWLIDNLSLRPHDTLWIAINEEVDDEFRIGQLVSKTFPNIDLRLLQLRHQTKGASETVC